MASNPIRPGTNFLKAYTPVLFEPKLLKNFYENSILAAVFNTDYQGRFQAMGDTIRIPKMPTIEGRPWHDGDQIRYPAVKTEEITMTIDHGYVWSFKVTALQAKRAGIKNFTNAWISDASKQTQKYTDRLVLNKLLGETFAEGNAGPGAGCVSGIYDLGTITKPVVLSQFETAQDGSTMNATDYLANINAVLDEQNVLSEGERVTFLCPKVYVNCLAKSELKRADIAGSHGTTLYKGRKAVGEVQGVSVFPTGYLTPIINSAGQRVFPVIANTKRAATFALQYHDTWSSVLEGENATGFRGFSVFGSKLIEPRAMAVGYVTWDKA